MKTHSRRFLWVILLCGAVQTAAAHSISPGMGAFYNGMLHPLLTVEQLLALLAAGLWLGLAELKMIRRALGILLLAGLGGWFIPLRFSAAAVWIFAAGTSLAGGMTALRRAPALALPLTALVGFAAASVGAEEMGGTADSPVFLAGLLAAELLVILLTSSSASRLAAGRPWMLIILRVAGSWLFAIGAMLFAWQWSLR